MNITHVTRRYWPFIGGVETFLKSLAYAQVKQGHNVKIVTLKNLSLGKTAISKLLDYEINNGITIHRLKGYGLHNYLYVPRLLEFFKDADIIHVHNVDYLSEYIGFLKMLHKKPIILTTHGGFFHGQNYKLLRLFRLKYFTSYSLRFYDYVLCTSKTDSALFGNYAKNSIRFPNAIYLPNIKEVDKAEHYENNLLYVGRLQKHKQVELLINSISLLVHKYNMNNVKCLVVGPDWGEKSQIRSLIIKNKLEKNVSILGAVDIDTLNELQANCGLFVSPSAFESFGIAVLESMSWGNLVLANNIPAHSELINHDENGWLIDYKNTENVAKLILKIICMPKQQKNIIRRKARLKAEEQSWNKQLNQLNRIYDSILNSKK